MSMSLPKQPNNPLTAFGQSIQNSVTSHFAGIDADFVKEDETKDEFFKNVRYFHTAHDDLAQAVKCGMTSEIPVLIESTEAILTKLLAAVENDQCARESKLGFVIEKSRSVLLLHRFFTEGRLATQASLQPCNDSEYIGAVLTFAQHLNQYVLGRACEGDVASINLCLNVVSELNAKMLEFDFRNGPLRRKYDGLKYAVRNIEDILFELSLQSAHQDTPDASPLNTDEDVGSPTKRMRIGGSTESTSSDTAAVLKGTTVVDTTVVDTTVVDTNTTVVAAFKYLDSDEIDAIRVRMDTYDQMREQVIKDSRDVQKLSKQGVYAVVRGQLQEARKKLDQAAKCADKIMETVAEYPTLRNGGFSNSLEEWAEGAITLEWVQNKRIPSMQELRLINASEYIGALSDFTGEIGRLAVMHAGKRDFEAVREIYQADLVVAAAINRISGNRFGKKLEMVNTNLKKVGDVIYELTMLQRSGRATRTKPVDLSAPPAGEGKVDNNED